MTEVKGSDMYTEQPTDKPTTANQPSAAASATAEESNTETPQVDGATETTATSESPSDAEVIAQLQAELTAAQAKSDELLDKLQRTAAEFQNSRRRQEKQLADEIERAGTHLIQRLLPVLDDLELAFQNVPAEVEASGGAWLEGLRQIQKKLNQLLEDRGITVIEKEGPFDPNRHEAVSSEPSETVASGHIIQTLRTGYAYKERVLRPALVRVAA
ncbi:MAG: nucleotide exchange factor GrpE [Caldilineaceae bacterium]|nr:nucleotide exchange factor GrpE [Caldilineaceae bacterium]